MRPVAFPFGSWDCGPPWWALAAYRSERGASAWSGLRSGSGGRLRALIGSQQSPDWLPKTAGRVWLIDASRLKMPAGSGEDVKVHSAYNLGLGRLEDVEVSDRHSAEGLHHFALRKGGCGGDRCGV